MSSTPRPRPLPEVSSPARFVVNGLVATAAHYLALVLLVESVGLTIVWVANTMATAVGVAVSYLGNRSYVFRSEAPHASALPRFLASYGMIFALHGAGMAAWADWAGLNYSVGFLILTGLSAVATYLLNRSFVFRVGEPTDPEPR